MRKLLMMMLLMAVSVTMFGQERRVEGILQDRDTEEAIPMTTVQLLKMDSTYVAGAVTDEHGLFVITAPENGKYLLRISSVGYVTAIKKIEIAQDMNLNMGRVTLGADAVMLKEVQATAQALKVTVVEDTFVYNSAAYRTPEGSAVEELVKLLPGAQVDDDGNITINGKQVKKIKMDGKEFMNGDTKTALKNLPTSIVERVKAYEGKSDRSRITGIDDGEDEMTLDFTIKSGMNKGLMGNANLGYGTENRYAERVMGMLFQDNFRMGVFTNFNNINDRGFGGRGGGLGRGRNGLNTTNSVGVFFNYENTGKLKIDGNVRWNHGTSESLSENSSENFVVDQTGKTISSFSNSVSQNYSKNIGWNAEMRLEWTPDTMTNIMVRPSVSWSNNDNRSASLSGSFNDDPFLYYTADEYAGKNLDLIRDSKIAKVEDIIGVMEDKAYIKNRNENASVGYSESKNARIWMQFNRKLNDEGRNLSFNASGNISDSNSKNFSVQDVALFNGANPGYMRNRYNETPSNSWNYTLQASYSEPIALKTYLQFSYKYNQSFNKSDRGTYDFSDLDALPADYAQLLRSLGIHSIPLYRNWGEYLPGGFEANEGNAYYDSNQSRMTQYKTRTHDIELQFRRVRDNYNMNFGVLAQPQHTNFIQKYLGKDHNAERTVVNVTPTADFRYYFSKRHQLRFNYRGSTAQPSMASMVEITDDTNPLNITLGNPNLKPSFTNRFNLNYNNFIENHYQTIAAWAGFSTTRNSTTSRTSYFDEDTKVKINGKVYEVPAGGRITRQENINGAWNAYIGGQYAVALDTLGVWNFNIEPGYNFNNNVGLVKTEASPNSMRNTTKTHNWSGRISLSFRNSWLNVEPDGSVNYTHSVNQLQPDRNMDTWTFSYGTNLNITFPWGMSIASDIHMRSRRGFNDASMNTNELIWNGQLSQTFLRGKNLSLSLQFYDILQNQSNFSRSISAMSRTDSWNYAINSFAMLTLNYRFSVMPGAKKMMEEMEKGRPDFNRPDMRGPQGGRPQGPPPGGFPGGGRPF